MSQKYNLVAKNVGVVGTGAVSQSDSGQQMNFFGLGSVFSSGHAVISAGMGASTSIGHTDGSVTIMLDDQEVVIPAPAGRIEVKNNEIFRNGVKYKFEHLDESKVLRIAQLRVIVNESVKGNVTSNTAPIEVRGSVTGTVSTNSGDVDVDGGVDGDVRTNSGNVEVNGEVKGSASSNSGDIKAHKFGEIRSRCHRQRD